jgi:hypothetical protein
MASAFQLYLTIDHQLILSWAQRRGALPSTIEGNEHPGPLFFNFGLATSGRQEISWDRFFTEFERADLAFIYRDDMGPNGELDDFHAFVARAAVPELVTSGKSTIIEQVL